MATKLKNLKNRLALFLLVSGFVCIVAGAGLYAGMQTYMAYEYGFDISDTNPDYQDTAEFKLFMEKRLAAFLSMAVYGSRISVYSLTSQNDRDGNYWFDSMPMNETYQNDNYMAGNTFHYLIEGDKNIAYTILVDGDIKYTNYTGVNSEVKYIYKWYMDNEWYKEDKWKSSFETKCPEGYNYELRYKDGVVTIKKDGVSVDVYGDGWYYGDDDWYVPGYNNFEVTDKLNDIEIVIYAVEKPKYFSGALYKDVKNAAAEYYTSTVKAADINTDSQGWFDINKLYSIDNGIRELINIRDYWRICIVVSIIFLSIDGESTGEVS